MRAQYLVLCGVLAATAVDAQVVGEVVGSDTVTIRNPGSYGKPNQSRLWFNSRAGRWDALVPQEDEGQRFSESDHYIVEDIPGEQFFTDLELEDRDFARPDVFWDDASAMLYVFSSHPVSSEFWRLRYVDEIPARYEIEVGALGAGVPVPGLVHPTGFLGGNSPGAVYVTANAHVWASVMKTSPSVREPAGLEIQHSSDGGSTWLSVPAKLDTNALIGLTAWVDFEDAGVQYVGVFAAENGESSPGPNTRFFFWYIDINADPSVLGNWVDDSRNIPRRRGSEESDDHVSAARDAFGNLYFAVKTEGGRGPDPLIRLFKRTPSGQWSDYSVTASADVPEESRPSIVIDDTNAEIHIYTNGAEVVSQAEREASRVSAPLNDLSLIETAPFETIFSEANTIFTDVITPRQSVTSGSDLVVLAHNRTDASVWYAFHEIDESPVEPPIAIVAAVDQDSWLKQAARRDNFGDEKELPAKRKGGDSERAVLRFDLSDIPAGAEIISAAATLRVTSADRRPVNVHRITDDWTEFSVNWRNTGNDYDRAVSTAFTPSQDDAFVSFDLGDLVQGWVCGAPNYGIVLIASSNDEQSKYYSRDMDIVNFRPSLEVDFRAGAGGCAN